MSWLLSLSSSDQTEIYSITPNNIQGFLIFHHQIYLQCYTHNNLGWKIHVVDPGYISEHSSGGDSSYDADSDQLFLYLVTIIFAIFFKLKWAIF